MKFIPYTPPDAPAPLVLTTGESCAITPRNRCWMTGRGMYIFDDLFEQTVYMTAHGWKQVSRRLVLPAWRKMVSAQIMLDADADHAATGEA